MNSENYLRIGILKNLFEDGNFKKIKNWKLEFWKFYFENGILKIKIGNLNFGKFI